MVEKYSKKFKINFRDVDFTYALTMNALVDFMQEVSGEHALALGVDFTLDEEQKYYWIVSRAKMHLDRYPKWQEEIRIETYPDGIDKLFAMRRFDIFNNEDEPIGYIIGCYILMDYETKRPIRIKNAGGTLAKLEKPYEGEEVPKLKAPIHIIDEDIRRVRSGEIDINGHMNNAYYVKWATDMITCEEYTQKSIESIQTNYITSLVEGDKVKVVRGLDEEGSTIIQGTSLDEKITYWTSKIVFKDL